MSNIKDIVFDLGKVLIDFDFSHMIETLQHHGAYFEGFEHFTELTALHDYERGLISRRQFLGNINSLLQEPISHQTLEKEWINIFDPVDEMLHLAQNLMQSYGVYILSNTSELHFDYLYHTYSLHQFSHGLLTSFEVGALKPDAAIYHASKQHFGLNAASTLFIDDKKENVAGAIYCGWHGIHHINYKQTVTALQNYAISV